MYSSHGSGLGLSFQDVMALPVRWKNRLLELLMERLDEEAEAMRRAAYRPGS